MVPGLSQIKSAGRPGGSFAVLAGTLAGLALAGVWAALPAAAAQAATATTCPETTLVQPFAKTEEKEKLKPGYYSLVSGGDFEAGEAAWTLSGGAKVASGGATSPLTGVVGKNSLDLPSGATAASPLTCVEPTDRTFRFLVRYEGVAATVLVKAVYENSSAKTKTSVSLSKSLTLSSSWAASPIFETGVPSSSMVSGSSAHLSISFTALTGTARIDDVYLDPKMR